ncbi:MAG: T9SS type A sorting domain-containing protein [Gilvibacter sp.]
MKKSIFFVLFVLFLAHNGFSQIIDFTDDDFKNLILSESTADANSDGEITEAEALLVSELVLIREDGTPAITSVGGLEYFLNLEVITIENFQISSLNLDFLTNVSDVEIIGNSSLLSIDLSNLISFSGKLYTFFNRITSIDISSLQTAGSIEIRDEELLETLSFPSLTAADEIVVRQTEVCANIAFPLLESVNEGGFQISSNDGMTNLEISSLNYVQGELLIRNNDDIVDFLAPNLGQVDGGIIIKSESRIENIHIPNLFNTKYIALEMILNLETFLAPSLISTQGFYAVSNFELRSVDFPVLERIEIPFGAVDPVAASQFAFNSSSLEHINAPLLEYIEGDLSVFITGDQFVSIDLDGLEEVGNQFYVNLSNTDELHFDALRSAKQLRVNAYDAIEALSFDQLENIEEFIQIRASGLVDFNIPSLQGTLTQISLETDALETLTISPEVESVTSFSVTDSKLNELNLNDFQVGSVALIDNDQLQRLFIKNGATEVLSIEGSGFLGYVCADAGEIASVQAVLAAAGLPDAVVHEYCTFEPSGDTYSIDGVISYDFESDGCDAGDQGIPFSGIFVETASSSSLFFANETGEYHLSLLGDAYTITPIFEESTYFEAIPSSVTVNLPDDLSDPTVPYVQDFCVIPVGVHPDVTVRILPLEPARPGFDTTYGMQLENQGNTILSDEVTFEYDEAVLDYVSASEVPLDISDGALTFEYIDLEPFEIRTIDVVLNVNAPTDTPPVNIGDLLTYTAQIDPIDTDDNPEDNTFVLEQIVVGSYDPNDKICLHGETITLDMVGEYVDYLIRFENTGTFAAENIVVKDTLNPAFYDVQSFKVQHGSHDFVTRVTDNIVEFIFEGINLPFDDDNNDGYVLFKIKTLETLEEGDIFSNKAGIYFDYNFPIITNDAITTVELPLGIDEFTSDAILTLYPNPASDMLTIQTEEALDISSFSIFGISGQLLYTQLSPATSIDVSNFAVGVYVIKIHTSEGVYHKRFVKK